MVSMLSLKGKPKEQIKTLAVRLSTYLDVLELKGEMEVEDGKVLSMDKVVKNLARCYREQKN